VSESIAYMLPDWVILGTAERDGGVVIYASTDLAEAELRVVERSDLSDGWPGPREAFARASRVDHVVMSTKMKTYIWVRGATYRDALRTLFEQWEPKRQERPAVGPQPALPQPDP
jgi:hypothetical protein